MQASATDYSLLMHESTTKNPLQFVSNGLSVAEKSATDLSVAKKSATTNLHPICAVADFVAKLF